MSPSYSINIQHIAKLLTIPYLVRYFDTLDVAREANVLASVLNSSYHMKRAYRKRCDYPEKFRFAVKVHFISTVFQSFVHWLIYEPINVECERESYVKMI